LVTTNEEQQMQTAEERTIGERMAAAQELLVDVVRENGRRSDEDYRALGVKIDALDTKFDAKMDRMMYSMLGIAGAVVVGIILQLVL